MYIVIDVGGTNTRIATTDLTSLQLVRKFETPQIYSEAVHLMEQEVNALAIDAEIEGICIGLPGIIDKANEVIVKLPNLSDWNQKEFKSDLASRLHTKVFLANDSALYGLAEAHEVDPHHTDTVAYIGVGTGVGGARITKGVIDIVNYGFEPGHQIIDYNNLTTLESQVSGRDIQDNTGSLVQDISDSEFWDHKHQLLAVGIYNSILHWAPDHLVLGGGMINKGTYKLDILTDKLNHLNQLLPALPKLHQSVLKDRAGLTGAMLYLKEQLNG